MKPIHTCKCVWWLVSQSNDEHWHHSDKDINIQSSTRCSRVIVTKLRLIHFTMVHQHEVSKSEAPWETERCVSSCVGANLLPTVTEAWGGSWKMTDGGYQVFRLDWLKIRDCLLMMSPFCPASLRWWTRVEAGDGSSSPDKNYSYCSSFLLRKREDKYILSLAQSSLILLFRNYFICGIIFFSSDCLCVGRDF